MKYKHKFDSGFDIYAAKGVVIPPHSFAVIESTLDSSTITTSQPKMFASSYFRAGYALYLWPKGSSEWLVGAGVVDIDYDDTVLVRIFNVLTEPLKIEKGQAICQGVIHPVYQHRHAEFGPPRHQTGGIKDQRRTSS